MWLHSNFHSVGENSMWVDVTSKANTISGNTRLNVTNKTNTNWACFIKRLTYCRLGWKTKKIELCLSSCVFGVQLKEKSLWGCFRSLDKTGRQTDAPDCWCIFNSFVLGTFKVCLTLTWDGNYFSCTGELNFEF